MSACRGHTAALAAALVAALLVSLPLSGCKSLTADGGMAFVEQVADTELRKEVVAIRTPDQAEEVHARVAGLLRKPLTADSAVQIALLNNRGLQAAFNALGIAEAEMVQAHLPPSPTVSIERLSNPLELEIERRIIGNILALVTLAGARLDRRRPVRAGQIARGGGNPADRCRGPARLLHRRRRTPERGIPRSVEICGGNRNQAGAAPR